MTADIGEAVTGAELVLMPGPATAQVDIARGMAAHLRDGQAILMPPGSFGTWVVMEILRQSGCAADLLLGEAGTLPWLARMQGPTEVAIVTRATRLPTGVFPFARADAAFALFQRAFPAIERLTDGLDGALMNAGPIIHPPLILMNAGPIEHFEHWDIHNEGTQPSIRRITDALDAERIAVREALGYGAPHFPLADHYDNNRPEWMYGQAAHDRLVVSSRWREDLDLTHHRYMREDVAIGLAHVFAWGGWQVDLLDTKDRQPAEAQALLSDAAAEVSRTLHLMADLGLCVAAAVPRLRGRVSYGRRDELAEVLRAADLVMEGVPETREAKAEALTKVPVVCKASPGFIVPRIQALAMNEAARMVEEGVASAEDMDIAIRTGFGPRFSVLGLVEFVDWGGVDILHHASRYMVETTGEERFSAPESSDRRWLKARRDCMPGAGFMTMQTSTAMPISATASGISCGFWDCATCCRQRRTSRSEPAMTASQRPAAGQMLITSFPKCPAPRMV
ncbi:MAG: NAD/NADP octopine/nopaline dehydrogenase family protein [Minwuia sp.]|nr:NAD/NADP octopine/nopaline dehydrogenase family protein [Minwuia sp.]